MRLPDGLGRLVGLGVAPARDPEEPIRSELFSIERLEQHAESLATAQRVTDRPGRGRPLGSRLRDNGRVLLASYRAIGSAIREERAITPAAEWLVDNFHIAEEQIREIRDDLPRGFYRQLPKLADGPLAGYPRVFGLAWAFVAHTDSLLDPQSLCRFVRAYQRVQPLTIGELWAVAITLRIVLVENLRRLAERVVRGREARQKADALADRLLGVGGRDAAEHAASVLHDLDRMPLAANFAAQLVHRLRDHDPAVTPALRWLDERLAAQGTTADDIVREEHNRQGAMNVTIRNVITSMRLVSAVDWAELIESVSLVDATLRAGNDFGSMDFATRDHIRHAIEALARGSGHTELSVAQRALFAAERARQNVSVGGDASDCRDQTPGYYLISSGRPAFEKELGYRIPIRERLVRTYKALGLFGYLGTITALTACAVVASLLGVATLGVSGPILGLLALCALIPASDAAIALVNRHVTNRFGASTLPCLELREGLPATLRTMVAVPMLLSSREAIDEQIERLEVHHLANPEDELYFALLSDWTDADTENAAGDEALLGAAAEGIARLNQLHPPGPVGSRFLLLHRRRVWTASESKWIGWERKRGKLHELNRLLRGAADTTFLPVGGGAVRLPTGIRFVITLDADTRLPRGAARRLVGKIAHPLNRPHLDSGTRRVVDGHAVLQPRVTPTMPMGRDGSLFQRLFAGPGGIDPYACAVSDVYQDLFGEGSYTGKGIYDVDAFEAAMAGRIPDGTLLSHDLLEGVFARAALVSDIEVVDEFPARYDVAAARQHRWARGDWQLLPWIFGRAHPPRDVAGGAIPAVGRWKMLDNLRRTLSAPATFLAFVVSWTLPLPAAAAWTTCIVALLALPPLLPFAAGIVPRRSGISKRSHASAVATDLVLALAQIAFSLVQLAHQAWLMTDAIVRTFYRLSVSRRNMLEWVTAAQAKLRLPLDVRGFYQRMAGGVVLATAVPAALAYFGDAAWPVAGPFLLAWILSPIAAQGASRPPRLIGPKPVSAANAAALRVIARRTWRFFDTFVTAEDHHLPPDNFQEDPNPVVAHRTSPTNLGLYLLSVVAARDFGWIGTCEATERLSTTLETMEGLERLHGHFFNWYETRDLRPLDPKYVSSVDSGNLAGHLLTLRSACREIIRSPVVNPRSLSGIEDALHLTCESLRGLTDVRQTQTVSRKQLEEALDVFAAALLPVPSTPRRVADQLRELARQAETVVDIAQTLTEELRAIASVGAVADVLAWARALQASVESQKLDLDRLMPWAFLAPSGVEPDGSPLAALHRSLSAIPTLAELPACCAVAVDLLQSQRTAAAEAHRPEVEALLGALEGSARASRSLERRLTALGDLAATMFDAMEFDFLFDPERQLLSIGYQVQEGRLDPSSYDLLASEARLASFIAIAKGDVPARHWFRLGRSLTPVDRGSALVSWSGSMFEYLMPSLVMRAPLGSLLEQTSRLVVRRQIQFGAERGVPWGVSESAYNARDLELTYQYSSFGVPGLGLKRGLSEDAVVAPYATALAAMVDSDAATQNLARLTDVGGRGDYGFYEALDFTPERIPEGEPVTIVRAYMAHHQGMTIVAIANTLHDSAMRARFHAEPIIQATELLLQERAPRDVAVARPRAEEVKVAANVREIAPRLPWRVHSPHEPIPRTHLLSNGRYAVMITAAGSGFSRWRNLAVTRWREDATCDAWGSYIYLRDVNTGKAWSAGFQPSRVEPDSYDVEFAEDRAMITRRDGTITTALELAVSAECNAEVRRVSLSNLGSRTREIELTSYAEIVLAPPAADTAHAAFSKLFVHTEHVDDVGVLLATRRRRSPDESEVWAAHLTVVEGESIGEQRYETDRVRFLGRGHDIHQPSAVIDGRPLSNTAGATLDPIFSLRRRLRIPPGMTARVAFWTLLAPSRNEALDLADKHQDPTAFERVVTLAWTQAQVQLHHLGIDPDEAQLFQRLANHVLYSDPTLRPPSEVLRQNEHSQSTLWAHGISGDLAIVLVRIDEVEELEIVRQLLRAHEYWRMKHLAVDLVILNERSTSYVQDLQGAVEALVRASQSRPRPEGEGARGNVFVLRTDMVSTEVRNLLRTVARVVLVSRRGSLAEQMMRIEDAVRPAPPAPVPPAAALPVQPAPQLPIAAVPAAVPLPAEIEFFNGLGGFTADGREYVTVLGEGQWTPAPWINVIANPSFGFHVSAEGSGYTWAVNSREHQLTPWSNDPVSDPPGEAIYVRDEDSGVLWTPTALPIREEEGSYVARHGQGYSRFERTAHGIGLELLQYVASDDPIKIARLKIHNRSSRTRRLSVCAYVEWVLGTSRGASAPFVITEMDAETGAMFARNPWGIELGNRVAFADLGGRQSACTGDRTEFIGRNGTLEGPAALADGKSLSNRVGGGFDPCGALQARVDLKPNATTEVVFFLGEAESKDSARSLVMRYRDADLDSVLSAVTRQWDGVLGAVQVKTPDRATDILLNRWLLYQTLACRVWARSAFYQASGAYGFRDQLQDVMALTTSQPSITRTHLLRAAARQFVEGDVQHWWLPETGQGVRTRISDDRIWLPYAVAHYVDVTHDRGILDEKIPFVEGHALSAGEHDSYFRPQVGEEMATLFEHCARALDLSLTVGAHGLPLMGTGDWNDGMNRVGEAGRGESVWLGWFLHAALSAFAPLADARGESERSTRWRSHLDSLRESLERDGWDGEWYRRGYFDDGTPLGSAANDECRIDSIAQSWAVISGAADPSRAATAMHALDQQLVRCNDRMVLLFTPPFDRTSLEPGYIKSYPPGIRENGGQYTHAAVWSVVAFAELGDGDRAGELFSFLNPINHTRTRAAVHRYCVEPYVVAADVYAHPLYVGRGGWTWYSGAAGWMYRAGLEWILGFRLRGTTLVIDPCVPAKWRNFEIAFRYHSARYEIAVDNPRGVSRGVSTIHLDGKLLADASRIPLVDDAAVHEVRVLLA